MFLGNYEDLEEGFVDFEVLPNSIAALTQLTRLQLEGVLLSDSLTHFSNLRRLQQLSLIIEDYEHQDVAIPLQASLLTKLQLHCSFNEVSCS